MKQLKIVVIALFTIMVSSTASAQDENKPWAVGLGVNVIDFYGGGTDFSNNFKDLLGNKDWNIGVPRITVERYLNKGFSLQLAGSLNKITTVLAKNDSDFAYYAIDALVKYDLNSIVETGWFDPYVYLGGGYTSANSQGEAMLNVGVGFNAWFTESFGLNFQTGTKKGFTDKVRAHYHTALGLVVKFGGKDTDKDGVYDRDDACPEVAGLKEFNGCPDADGDGVKDSDDACPNIAGLAVMNGCPDTDGDEVADKDDMCPNAKGTKANKGCPDADGDGVIDKDDKCANAAGPAANAGCPWPDTDGDGVLDKDDKCPTVAGPASENGCEEPKGLTKNSEIYKDVFAKTILFNLNSDVLKSAFYEQLDRMIVVMKKFPKSNFSINGHTDSSGAETYNFKLSANRANTVRDYIIKNGIQASRLSTEGFGLRNPVAPNSTKKGRAENRRVRVELLK